MISAIQKLQGHYSSYRHDPIFPTHPILACYFTLIDYVRGKIDYQ